MWSARSEPVELYLGPGLALVSTGRNRSARALSFQPDTSLAAMLEKLTADLAVSVAKRRWHARVALSGVWCPAVSFHHPSGVDDPAESHALARAFVEEEMPLEPESLRVRQDRAYCGLASGCDAAVLETLHDWSRSALPTKGRLSSVSPVWAIASQCALARRHVEQGLLVHEPSCVTALLPRPAPVARSWWRSSEAEIDALTVERGPEPDRSVLPVALVRYLEALSPLHKAPAVLSLNTHGAEVNSALGEFPKFLAAHWGSRIA